MSVAKFQQPAKFDATALTARLATVQDVPGIMELVVAVRKEFNLNFGELRKTDPDLFDFEKSYLRTRGTFMVIEFDGQILATVGLAPRTANICEMKKLYLHPTLRGKGIGRRLFSIAYNWACELGYLRMVLETSSNLKVANEMYRKWGFKKHDGEILHPGVDLLLIKDL